MRRACLSLWVLTAGLAACGVAPAQSRTGGDDPAPAASPAPLPAAEAAADAPPLPDAG